MFVAGHPGLSEKPFGTFFIVPECGEPVLESFYGFLYDSLGCLHRESRKEVRVLRDAHELFEMAVAYDLFNFYVGISFLKERDIFKDCTLIV